MIIDNTPLDFEIRRIMDSDFKPPVYGYTGQFKIGDKIQDIIRIVGIDEEADYELTYGSVIMLDVIMPLGDYSMVVYPGRENLEFILKTEALNYATTSPAEQEDSVTVMTYSASLLPDARPYMAEDNGAENSSREIQNLIDFVRFTVQLKPKLLDDINNVTIGGHWINTTTADFLRNSIVHYCNELDLPEDEMLMGVDIHASASEDVRSSIVIPHGKQLYDLADYVQANVGGVFPSGMAQFIYERHWYIYPPYDTSGFDESKEKIIIISVPAKRYPQVEKTYLTANGITTILSTGNKKITSDKHQIQDNAGNGVMFADANQMVTGFSEVKGNVALAQRSKNVSAFVGEHRTDGKNNVRMSPEIITSNPFVATSRLARSQGHFYTVEWENGDPKIIKPGLNVKIMYLNQGEVKYVNGVLLKSHKQVKMNGTGLMSNGFRTFIVLVIFVRAEDNDSAGLIGLT